LFVAMSWLCARATEASVPFQVSAGQPTAVRSAFVSARTCCSYVALVAGALDATAEELEAALG